MLFTAGCDLVVLVCCFIVDLAVFGCLCFVFGERLFVRELVV